MFKIPTKEIMRTKKKRLKDKILESVDLRTAADKGFRPSYNSFNSENLNSENLNSV